MTAHEYCYGCAVRRRWSSTSALLLCCIVVLWGGRGASPQVVWPATTFVVQAPTAFAKKSALSPDDPSNYFHVTSPVFISDHSLQTEWSLTETKRSVCRRQQRVLCKGKRLKPSNTCKEASMRHGGTSPLSTAGCWGSSF